MNTFRFFATILILFTKIRNRLKNGHESGRFFICYRGKHGGISMEITEVIVKYHGSLGALYNMGIRVDVLYGGFAILTIFLPKLSLCEIWKRLNTWSCPAAFIMSSCPWQRKVAFMEKAWGMMGAACF